MRRFPLRRFIGTALSFLILAGAPGAPAYHAAAQSVGARGAAAEAGSAARGVPALNQGLSSPIPVLSPTALTAASILAAPVAAPNAVLVPSALPVAVTPAQPASARAVPAKAVAVNAVKSVGSGSAAAQAAAARVGPAPAAIQTLTVAASAPEKLPESGRMFDGGSAKAPAASAATVPASPGITGYLRRGLKQGALVLSLTVATLGIQAPASAQQAPPAPPAAVAPAAPAAPAAAQPAARVELPRPVTAEAAFDRQGMTVGERLHVTFTLKNTSDKPVTLHNLRSSIQEALPEDLELQGKGAEAPLTLAPGETKVVVYEAIPFGSGVLSLENGIAVVAVSETETYPNGIDVVLPKTELTVKTVLTPDWKEKGLRDIVGVKRGEGPNWMWLAAIPLGLLMLVGVHRLVAARKLYPKLDAKRLSTVVSAEAEIARLRAEESLDSASFLARYSDLVAGFMVDFAGLPKAARDAKTLERDLGKSFYDDGQVAVAGRLAAQAEAARFSGAEVDAKERGRMLDRAAALVESVAKKSGRSDAPAKDGGNGGGTGLAALALLPGAAGLTFGSPWVLLLLIPYAAYVLWAYRSRGAGEKFAVSSAAQAAPKARTWRERMTGLPKALRLLAIGLIIVALGRPMIGTQRNETFIPSTDTMVSIDLSGSMSGQKLQNVREAVRAYVEEQRRGTENRVGMVTFSDNAYLDVKLTTDYDALIAHLKELETTGSTAVGKSMLTAIGHFLELNALDLDGKADPRAAEVQRLLRDQGLPAALAYAKQHPDLMKSILQPERVKIVVVFTDGESNSGIEPQAAAEIARQLGVKVYTVGIGDNGRGYDSKTLREVAEITGAKSYMAGDAQGMAEVLLEIARLEKSPAKIVSAVSIKDYTSFLAVLALLLLAAEMTLANTRLRSLYGLALVIGLNGSPLYLPVQNADPAAASRAVQSAQLGDVSKPTSPTSEVPAEVIEGNRLYNQGRFAEALKKYGEAIERHPDVPEIYFNMADAYLRLGQNEKADAAWAKYLSLTPDPKRQSQTLFNLGNSALAAGDAQKAIEFYKEALRRDSGNEDAKWNLEALRQAQKEQEQNQQQQDGKQKGKPGKGKPKPGQGKPGEGQPGEGQPGEGQPGDGQPGDGKPGDGKPGEGKPKPGEGKPADPKEGADKLGDALGQQEGGEKDAARRGMTRRGSGVWGFAALPMAFLGQGVVFSSTAFLWVVGIGLPLGILLFAWSMRKKLAAARRLSPATAPKSFASWTGARRFLGKSALTLGAAALVALAAGDPRGGAKDERVNFGGKDIVVTVDGSHSMIYAEDGRMERTQKELNEFITRLQGTDRVGLVVFAGKPRTASPISIEYGNFEFKINRLDVEARGIGEGSNLAAAIKYSARHFDYAKKLGDRQRIMIVISDGDVPDAELEAAIAAAAEHKVTVYAIGVGDAAGTKIKVPTADGSGTEYLIDSNTGQPAITRLNEGPLRKLAERTGGAYFTAGGKTSIDGILSEVSRLEQGQKGDVIKSPSPVGVYLLWPALLMLLLDLILPGRSLLKRGAARPEAAKGKPEEKKPAGPGGSALMGLGLIPLGAWPQILPFAILATFVAAYLAADSWSGGKITRGIREWWETRRGFVPTGVLADLIHIYDLREADERRLAAFVKGWQDAKDESLREALITLAARDEALWREKLSAAYLSGAAPETLDKVLTVLRRTGRQRLEPLKPVVERIAARRAQLAWMAHTEAETRVAALRAVADGQPAAFEAPAVPAAPAGRWARVKRGASVATLALLLALTGASTVGTFQFREQQRIAAEASMKLFYAEDLFIFTDRYVDARITEQVLPALKRWHESPKTAGDDFERALTILRESPDPKADNILVAIFRRSGVLPLTNQGETILLRSLIERQNDVLWAAMDQLIQASARDEGASRMLVKLVLLGVEDGDLGTVVQLFRVLKSPNKQVQQASASALFGFLSRDGGAKFFPELMAAQSVHQNDPMLQMWTASFAFRRLGQPGATEADLTQSKVFFDAAIVNAARIDTIRVEIYKNTPPGQEVQAPPSLTAILLGMAGGMQGDGGAPAPLAGAARYVVTKAATALILDAEAKIPGLHERLVKDGVVLPDTQSYGGGYDDYHDYHDRYYGRGYYGGGSYSTKNYRDAYKLAHLRALAAAIEEMGKPLAENKDKNEFAVRELLDRAGAQIEAMLETGAKAGMMEGGSVPEAAADDLYGVLKTGNAVFSNGALLRALRAQGLAPASGDTSGRLGYPEALDAAALAKLRAALLAIAQSGKSWNAQGAEQKITWAEKLWIAGALDTVDAVRAQRFPDAEKPAAADEESLSLARLSARMSAADKDGARAVEVQRALFERAAKAPLDADEAGKVLSQTLAALAGDSREAAAIESLVAALKGPNGGVFAPTARARAAEALKQAGEAAERGDASLKKKLVDEGVRESESSWRPDVKLRHFKTLIRLAPATARDLSRWEGLAAAAGMPAGNTPGELAADETNVVLLAGYRLFPSTGFNDALRAAKLMPGAGNVLTDYDQSYTRAELEALRDWLRAIAVSGRTPAPERDLNFAEQLYLAEAIERVEAIIAKHFGVAAASAPVPFLELAQLHLELKRVSGDAARVLRVQSAAFAALAARPAATAEAAEVLRAVAAALEGTESEAASYRALYSALNGPAGAALKEIARDLAQDRAVEIGRAAENAFDPLRDSLVEAGVRMDENDWRDVFKQRHYRLLRQEISSAALKIRNKSAEQRAAAALAARLLPLLETVAAASGVSTGEEPGDVAAELLNEPLALAYQVFPGVEFNNHLTRLGVMSVSGGAVSYKESYDRADVVKIAGFLADVLKNGWNDSGSSRRALTDAEKEAVERAAAAAARALAAFTPNPRQTRGFGLLPLAPAALAALPPVAPWLLFLLAGAAVAYAGWRLLRKSAPAEAEEPASREAIDAATLARSRRIELVARRMATAVNGGAFRSRFIGSGGTEFAEARPYQGEDRRDIDWKTSAKKDELYSKKFELERDMALMLVVDVSRSGRFGTRGEDKRSAIEDAAAVLALAASQDNIRVGAILVSDRVEAVIPPKGGRRHAMQFVDAILKAEASGAATDLRPGLETAARLLRSRAMVAVISDFIAPDFKDALGALAARHDVRPIRVTDPAEMAPLPDVGLLPVVDAETGATRVLDTSSKAVRAETAAAISRREAMIENSFESARLRPVSISTEGDPLESLEAAFHPKAKQPFKP